MNAQAPLPKPNDLKISCVLAEVIGLAETNPKDFSDLFAGVGTLLLQIWSDKVIPPIAAWKPL